tara:strand:+ start:1420 stop:2607 length:1188 start_codon:yes stop_codon:yes gene_type:complete
MLRSFVKRYREYYPDELYEIDHPWTGFLVDQGWVRVANFLNFEGRDHLVSPHAWESAADLIIDCVVKKQLDPETTVVTVAGYGKVRYSVSQIVREWGGRKAEDRLFESLMARTAARSKPLWHITKNRNFKPDRDFRPVSTGGMDIAREPTLFATTSPHYWHEVSGGGMGAYTKGRKWAAELEVLPGHPPLKRENPLRPETMLDPAFVRVKRVVPVEHAIAEETGYLDNEWVGRNYVYKKASSFMPDSKQEVEDWVEEFGVENNYTPGTCDLNRGDCDMMSNVFADWLEDETGADVQLWSGQGFTPPLGKDANDLWIMLSGDQAHKRGEKPLSHVVAVWGKWVIDLTGRQFGSKYRAPVYPLSEFKKNWAATGRTNRANRGINNLRRMMLQNQSEW